MNGLLLIDKPQGITSHDVVRRLRRVFKTRRVGHAGTLDPLATGLLLVAINEGTRILQFLMEGDKTYRATLKLGETTDTQDSEGKVLETRPVEGIDEEAVLKAARSLVGTISQVPPMYSALKKNGVPLYKLARQGVEVEREARTIEIGRLEVENIDLPSISFEVDCSKGTYVRTLCHDLGEALGCGAHLTALRRTRSSIFDIADAIGLEELEKLESVEDLPQFLPITEALREHPAVEILDAAAARLRDGVPPELSSVLEAPRCPEGDIVLLLHGGKLLAVTRFAPSRAKEKRGDFELLRVFNSG